MYYDLISVIIPTYNRKDLLPIAVDSVLNQTYKNIEVIIYEDCSTDGTDEFIREKYCDEPRVKYFRNEQNAGPGITRKRAFAQSKGKYINFLDDDDHYINSSFYEEAIKVFSQNPGLSFVAANYYYHNLAKNIEQKSNFNISGRISGKEYFMNCHTKYAKPVCCFSIFTRESFSLHDDTLNILNDTTLFLYALLTGDAYFLDIYAGYVVKHGANISFSCSADFIIENLDEKLIVSKLGKERFGLTNKQTEKRLHDQLDMTTIYYLRYSSPSEHDYNKIMDWYRENVPGIYKRYGKIYEDLYFNRDRSQGFIERCIRFFKKLFGF